MSNMASFDRVVANMMNKFSTTATILVEGAGGVYDVPTSTYVTTDAQYNVRAMFFDHTLQRNGLGTLKDSLIEEGDRQVFIQPTEKTSNNILRARIRPNKDRLKIGAEVYKIITYKELNPSMADNTLIELYVRK